MRLPRIFQPRDRTGGEQFSPKGFTLIEVVIGMAIIAFLAGLGLFLSMDFYRGYSFNYERSLVVSSLQKARSRAMANINQTSHGFYFDNGNHQYVVFQGIDYAHRDAAKDESFSSRRTIAPSGLPEVVFKQLSGSSDTAGNIVLTGEGKTANISINEEGAIEW